MITRPTPYAGPAGLEQDRQTGGASCGRPTTTWWPTLALARSTGLPLAIREGRHNVASNGWQDRARHRRHTSVGWMRLRGWMRVERRHPARRGLSDRATWPRRADQRRLGHGYRSGFTLGEAASAGSAAGTGLPASANLVAVDASCRRQRGQADAACRPVLGAPRAAASGGHGFTGRRPGGGVPPDSLVYGDARRAERCAWTDGPPTLPTG